MRFTEQYAQLQKELHARNVGYGTSGYKHGDRILDLAQKMKTRSILDYGCGQRTLAKIIPFPITSYDPMLPGYDDEPEPHDLVVCGDVLEHIEPECLIEVLAHLKSKTKAVLFADIACRPAKKSLADGRNAHIIQASPSWWLSQLASYFDPQSFQTYEGGFVGVWTPTATL